MDKAELRLKLREIRRNIENREAKSDLIISRLINFKLFQHSKSILTYYGGKKDVNSLKVIEISLKTKLVYLPFIKEVEIGPVTSLEELQDSEYDVLIPAKRANPDAYQSIDIIIIPGLGFDRKGNRIGHGIGWYDKMLSIIPESVPRVGLSFSELVLDEIPSEPHDQLIDYVITDKEIINTHARGNHFATRYL